MLEFIAHSGWIIIYPLAFLAIVYSLVRLVAIAWFRTKREYDKQHFRDGEFPNRNQPDEEK